MALMLRSLRPLKPAINAAFPVIFQSKTETWCRLACQRMGQMRKITVLKRCLATQVDRMVERDNSRLTIHKLDRILQELDIDVRRTGRIGKNNVIEILNEIQLYGNITSTQSLLLIRCCGSVLAAEFPADRIELLNQVLKLLKDSNVTLDISHYNAILKVHLENGCKISPTDFLANMASENIEPNRVTYQRLVAYYCQQGDINGASKILEFMKSKNLSINENVFNALVEGHVKQGDIENAKAILNVMRSAKLEPTADTYLNLIIGYAEKGDLEEINNLLIEAEKNDAGLADKDILEIIYTLAVNGHSQHVDEMITKLTKRLGYHQDVINISYRLINNQQEDLAFKLLLTMGRGLPDADPIQSGHFFIKQLVKVGTPFEKILQYCDELNNQNLNSVGILKAVEGAFQHKNPDYALRFISVLQERGSPIRSHYFWPILACYKNNSSKIFETLQTMISMKCVPSFDTLLDYVIPNCNITDVDELIQQLKDLGINTSTILNAVITRLVMQKKLNAAANIVRASSVKFVMGYALLTPLASAAAKLGDLPNTLLILKSCDVNRDDGGITDWAGLFIRSYLIETGYNSQKLEELLTGFKENQISIHSNSAKFVQSKFPGNSHGAINDLLNALILSGFPGKLSEEIPNFEEQESGVNFRHLELKDLEKYYNVQKSNNMNVKGVLRKLLFLYCHTEDLENAIRVKSELDDLGFIYSRSLYVALLVLYIRHDVLDKALECQAKLKETDSNFSLDGIKSLKFATLLIKNGLYDDAEKILISCANMHEAKLKAEALTWSVWRLLNAATDTKNPQVVSKFYDLLFNKGFAEPNNKLLGFSVKVHILNDNIDEALKEFENCCQKYRCTPMKNDLLTHFIKQEDAVRLQKVVDLTSDVHGEMNALLDLAYVFIINDQFKQARKVLETPGLRARNSRLIDLCEGLINNNKIFYLEQLVTLTKDIFEIDRDEMYFQLLRGYAKLDDTEKAMGVWTSMQEESVQPRNRTLVFLSNLLKRHDKPVPFTVASDDDTTKATRIESPSKKKHHVESVKNLIKNGEVDRALSLQQKLETELSPTDVFVIVEALAQGDYLQEALCLAKDYMSKNKEPQPRLLRFLFSKLADGGKVIEILSLKDKLSPDAKTAYDNYLAKAFVKGNQLEELLKWLETDFPSDLTSFNSKVVFDMLIHHPEYSDRIHKLATSFADKNNSRPLNVMWTYYFIQENYEKADEIYKSTPSFQEKLFITDVIQVAKKNKNESMARKLVDVVKSSRLSNQIKGFAYDALVYILNGKGDPTKALEIYNEACEAKIEGTSFKNSTLLYLKKGLENQGVAIPATITSQLAMNSMRNESSESSSDSSSDDDEKETRL